MKKNLQCTFWGLSLILIGLTSCKKETFDLIIRNATVVDGTGAPEMVTDIGVRSDTISFMGDLSDAQANEIVDAKGLVLSPGFIDTHSHHGWGLRKNRQALAAVSQGITTIVVGQDGGSEIPLKKYFDHLIDSPVAVNLASYAGHNSIRDSIMGENFKRQAAATEIEQMKKILRADLEAGALGLSTGLEYDPGIYSAKEEVLELSKLLPEFNARYISHLRSEDRYFHEAIDEIIEIGRLTGAPVQISHFKLAMRKLWGQSEEVLAKLDKARADGVQITADLYPYPYWSSTIRVLFPDRNFSDLNEAKLILSEVTSAEGILFSSYDPNPEYNGKTLAQVAVIEKRSPEVMLIELIRRLDECERKKGDCDGSIVATSMAEADIEKLMQWPNTSICSDGASSGRHPRGFGAFPRVLAKYVREQKVIDLPEAIHKMTDLSAQQMGFKKRGRIAVGNYADLVLFDPALVQDRSTTEKPQETAIGIIRVWVNGKPVYSMGETTGQLPGKVLLGKN